MDTTQEQNQEAAVRPSAIDAFYDYFKDIRRELPATLAAQLETKFGAVVSEFASGDTIERLAMKSQAYEKALVDLQAEKDLLQEENEGLRQQLSGHVSTIKELQKTIGELPEGAHPDEWQPRAETWLQERANWQAENERLRQRIKELDVPVINPAPAPGAPAPDDGNHGDQA